MHRRAVTSAKDSPDAKQRTRLNENDNTSSTNAKEKLNQTFWARQCAHRENTNAFLSLWLCFVIFLAISTNTFSNDKHNLHQYNYPHVVSLNDQEMLSEVSVVTREQQDGHIPKVIEIFNAEKEVERQKNIERSKYYQGAFRDPLWEGDCQPMHSWQETLFPSCNKMHEIDFLSQMSYWSGGGYNDIFKLKDLDYSKYIVKILNYGTSYKDRNYDRVRRDALIMERLTRSPYIVNMYSHCGFSQVVEYGRGKDLDHPLYYQDELTSYQKLQLATQVAQGLADAHNIDGDDISSISHGDFKPSQYINVDGIYKLNDFNRGRFIRWDAKKQEPCAYTIGHNDGKFRAPEEYKYLPETPAIDVWALGSILYRLLTGHNVWSKLNEEKAQQLIMNGETPPIPDDVQNSGDPVDQVLMKTIDMCYVYDPKERPKASAVVGYLKEEAEKLGVDWQAPFKFK